MDGMLTMQVLYVLAELGIADCLAHGPQSANQVAKSMNTDPLATYRLLRSAAGLGLLDQRENDCFALTPLGECLKSDAPGYGRSMVRSLANPTMWRVAGEFMYSIQTGKPAWNKVVGQSVPDYLHGNPVLLTLANEMMLGFHGAERAAVAAAYDFSKFALVADIGGGLGQMLAAVLASAPALRGLLFEIPATIFKARQQLGPLGLLDRCELVEGDFFASIPSGADAYLLSHVIHDWEEDLCLTILKNCRQAMTENARLLIVEMVIPAGSDFHPGKMLDLQMLAFTGGRERSAQEYAQMLVRAGFRMARVIPTATAVSIVEAIPAD